MDPVMRVAFEQGHAELARLFELEGYKGYKPEQREAPNSDGRVDAGKRYLHVAMKYTPPPNALIWLALAHFEACKIAEKLQVPAEFYPRVENGTLRVLEYPADSDGTAEHTDFDLFTVNLWRSTPNDHEHFSGAIGSEAWRTGAHEYHIGRIGEMIGGLGKALPHRVQSKPYAQRALVYFAMPANGAVFRGGTFDVQEPDEGDWGGRTVQDWLNVVYPKSRVYAK